MHDKKSRHVTIDGRRWKMRKVRTLRRPGDCDDPNTPGKEIRLRDSLKGKKRLDVIMHEVIHAWDFKLDEEAVMQFGNEVSQILWDEGYRNINELKELG